MASIARDKNGNRRILFVAPGGDRRPAIRMGKTPLKMVEQVKTKVEYIVAAKGTGVAIDGETARWLGSISDDLHEKLARVGLVEPREKQQARRLEEFVESYITRRVDVSPHTRRIWRQTARLLVSHFGGDTALADVRRGAAAEWRLSLVASGLADATVRKHCGFAKHFFAQAVDHELIPTNPFGKLVSSPVGNEARQRFITREATEKVVNACPDAEWRLIVALSRYGGLRCPSEHLALRWGDIDWERSRLHVRSPKTARHAGHESRLVPLFPELRPFLDAAWDAAEEGAEFVIAQYRNENVNLRTRLTRIVRQAGLSPWPRIFHNLRASRATELAQDFPAHVASAWLGHSSLVAHKHYWQVTDDDFDRAIADSAESGAQGARNAAQQAAARNTQAAARNAESPGNPGAFANHSETLQLAAKSSTEVHGNRTHRTRGQRASQRF